MEENSKIMFSILSSYKLKGWKSYYDKDYKQDLMLMSKKELAKTVLREMTIEWCHQFLVCAISIAEPNNSYCIGTNSSED